VERASNPRTVVLFPGALGDLLLALPALRALRAGDATAHHVVAVNGALTGLATVARLADEVASFDDADTAGLFGGSSMPHWFGVRPRVHAWIGARDPATRAALARVVSSATFHRVVRDDGPDHAAVAYAEQVGVDVDRATLAAGARIVPPASERVDAVLRTARRPVLALHAGAGSAAKRWDPDGFAAVAAEWARRGDVLELVGPADHELPALGGSRRLIDWSLPDLAALLAGVDAYVGNDSGVSHLAAAVGARGAAVFVATRAGRWAPLGARVVAITHRDAHTPRAVLTTLARP